eukprot:CAMPEP_0113317830 /NCGR_PEP_ID=MMETSP0010_2-20120614/12608_1 /TAXON_ID=216773 ORGANISM="Corethron hystrix, Strain 308" /NCGR_SAMPLE_ID=MMETSP0010_2 /ASSEMBLY_ACC=CAM_ASM_000155 /LENGTH=287 /DNA_ID=CAMNT_0000174943 /DNA_START=212 /DNA_END=1072 /DNA_ORIENTATION=+ /assembly_acc=CAM_ASM_000155
MEKLASNVAKEPVFAIQPPIPEFTLSQESDDNSRSKEFTKGQRGDERSEGMLHTSEDDGEDFNNYLRWSDKEYRQRWDAAISEKKISSPVPFPSFEEYKNRSVAEVKTSDVPTRKRPRDRPKKATRRVKHPPKKVETDERVTSASSAVVPLLQGTLTFNPSTHQHVIKGTWNFVGADLDVSPSQHFQFIRDLPSDANSPSFLPLDGIYQGSFNMLVPDGKGKKNKGKKKIVAVSEHDVYLNFIKDNDHSDDDHYKIIGQGKNKFGKFEVTGHAKKNSVDGTATIELR